MKLNEESEAEEEESDQESEESEDELEIAIKEKSGPVDYFESVTKPNVKRN